ncbi:hypothetical protein M1M92_01580 [Peptococcaceae bacterium]|nr:hypothetical protein [Peptococcaceae bacterium]MCL0106691.1 hypothetical protein [Peptococcaceae bacterium]
MIAKLKAKWTSKKFTKTEKIGLIVLLLGALFYAYLTYIYDPLVLKFEQKQAELSTIEQEIAALGGRVPHISGIEKEVAEKKVEVSDLEQQLAEIMAVRKAADEVAATKVLAQITDLVIDSGLEMISMTVTSPVEKTAEAPVAEAEAPVAELFTWWKCNLELQGSIQSLNNFVQSLLAMEKILLVDHLEWSVDEEQGEYKITMSILF